MSNGDKVVGVTQAPAISEKPPSLLEQFGSNNPECRYVLDGNTCIVHQPWGDDSIHLEVPLDTHDLHTRLNSIRLPPQFSAIRHTSNNDVEFIYAALKPDNEERSRKFVLHFNGLSYNCAFENASETLKQLALNTRALGPTTDTNFRNLASIRQFLKLREQEGKDSPYKLYEVTSFWIRNCSVSDEELVELCRTLNFYMIYFDRRTPYVVIHSKLENTTPTKVRRYPRNSFPNGINAKSLDPYILSIWEGAHRAAEVTRQFVLYYQILEYAGFYYLRENITRDIKRIIDSPEITTKYREVAKDILDVVVEDKQDDEAKIDAVVKQFVDPQLFWPDVEANIGVFSRDTIFEGGLIIAPLVLATWQYGDFESAWHPKLISTLRQIRNALVHAREKRASKCIMPTHRNQRLLQPWCMLIEDIAKQLIIYADL